MPSRSNPSQDSVFLNVPYDGPYEPLFISLVSVLICLGKQPHCVLEIVESGQGRLRRITKLLQTCGTSIHDLSRQGVPARFNMPFELGLAWALRQRNSGHRIVLMDAQPHRLEHVLSDLNGHDPLIHRGTCRGIVSKICGITGGDVPPVSELEREARILRKTARELVSASHGSVFDPVMFRILVAAATVRAQDRGYLAP